MIEKIVAAFREQNIDPEDVEIVLSNKTYDRIVGMLHFHSRTAQNQSCQYVQLVDRPTVVWFCGLVLRRRERYPANA